MRILLATLFCTLLAACAAPQVYHPDTRQLQAALDGGADPNQAWMGNRPLMYQLSSARRDYDPDKAQRYVTDPVQALANIRLLLKAGANPDEPENSPPLYYALKYCLPEIAEALLDAGASPHAMAYGDVPMVMALAPNSHCPSVDDQYSMTMLLLNHVEKKEGREAMLRYARIESGNYSLLHIAAWQKFYGVLAALIEKRVDLNTQVKIVPYLQQTAIEMYCGGCTALHLAEGVGHTDIADALRRAGASSKITNAQGLTADQFRGRFIPGSSTTEKLAAAGSIAKQYASMNVVGLLKTDVEKGMELEMFRRAQRIDNKSEDVRRREGGPVYPPQDWRGLENAISRAASRK